MGFKNFRIHVVIRVLLIVASSFLFAYLIRYTEYSISAVILGFIIVYQVYALVSFVETTNRKLTGFLQSIKHADFSSSFTDHGLGKSFDELNNAFNEVIQEFRKYRSEREEHLNYLFTVIQHVNIGIIAFKDDGIIDQYNQAVLKLFKIKNIRHLNDLAVVKTDLPARLHHLKAGDKTLVKLFIDDEILQIAVNATQFRMRGQDFTLISLQNIHNELEEKEIESWQKLIRVLTHEIMNSITPISSLAGTVKDILIAEENDGSYRLGSLDDEQVEAVHSALSTISKRTQGLLNFVEVYRNLTRIPKPNFRYFKVADLFVNAELLIRPKTEMFQIECECIVKPENLMITADPDLIDQVIINLLLNAMDAVKTSEHPKISLIASEINGRIKIEVRDNGMGIKPDIMDKIFMPFFTSKKHGSGIGLSLSRQIMHLHKGTISVKSKPDEGSVFTLLF
ncbi:MAG TPA: ATP-binding protein [Bacteroidales bacterium]|nr:ATP-binding protein [Bacteroidales bacterium]HPR56806.1 ATP-binding protein [Bacteroidales bacterium]